MRQMVFARRLFVVAAFAAAWADCAQAKEAGMDEAVFGKPERVYVGRFSLEVPAGAKRYGEKFEVRDLELREVVFGEPLEKAFAAAWSAKLGEIEALKAKRFRPRHMYGEIDSQHQLGDRFAAVLYYMGNVKGSVRYAALRQIGATGLWLTRPGDTDDLAQTLATIKTVALAYVPRATGEPPAKGGAFHLPAGAVMLPYQEQESANILFRGGPLDVEIQLSTESTVEPQSNGLMARFGEAVARAGAAMAAGASVVRNRGRTAAGMKGEEFVMRDSEKGRLFFIWEYKGEKDSGARPEIQLQLTTKDERQKEKMAYWDALVDSLQPAASR